MKVFATRRNVGRPWIKRGSPACVCVCPLVRVTPRIKGALDTGAPVGIGRNRRTKAAPPDRGTKGDGSSRADAEDGLSVACVPGRPRFSANRIGDPL